MPRKKGKGGKGRGRGDGKTQTEQVEKISRGEPRREFEGQRQCPPDPEEQQCLSPERRSPLVAAAAAAYTAPILQVSGGEPNVPIPESTVEETSTQNSGLGQASTSQTPPSVEETSESQVEISIELKPEKKFTMTTRPDRGKAGKSIDLIANYFSLRFQKDFNIYHYDVDIVFLKKRKKDELTDQTRQDPLGTGTERLRTRTSLMNQGRTAKQDAEKRVTHVEHQQKRAPAKQKCRQVIAELIKSESLRKYNPVYDGQKNIYTTKPLNISGKKNFTLSLEEGSCYYDFQIVIQPVEKYGGTGNLISLEPLWEVLDGRSRELPQEIIMALDTVICHRTLPLEQAQVGRSFFMLAQNPFDLGKGAEIWAGYSQSVRLTDRGPAVIINLAAKAFHKAIFVIDYASDILEKDITKLNYLDSTDIQKLSEAFSNLRVEVTHLKYPRRYPVKAVTKHAASEMKFEADGQDITVSQYFLKTYDLKLLYPYLPCLHMRCNNNTTYVPMECCKVAPNQPILGKLPGTMNSKMITQTAINPADRFKKIQNELESVNRVSGATMDEFGLQLEYQPMKLQGRVLNAPSLTYHGSGGCNSCKPDSTGKWRMDGRKFLDSPKNCSWILLNFTKAYTKDLENLASLLVSSAQNVGLGLEKVLEIVSFGRRDTVRQALRHAKDRGVAIAFIILYERDEIHSYDEIKFVADIELQLPTQCLNFKMVKEFNPQIATNIILKMNSKLGGINHALLQPSVVFDRPTIVFGADAAHSPRGYACPSIAALVGSLDEFPSQYAVTCRVQNNPDEKKFSQEIIIELKEMTKCILGKFIRNARKYPERIIFFRDGVSEGQFTTVLETEIVMVQEACKEALEGNVPPITYIVVQKRHQTRFRPQKERDAVNSKGNIPPGTTVDTDVTHPIFFDFFLCSHEGIQGTSKPAHYTVIFDENNFSSDQLQKLCYDLCYVYARCNRSISVPPPIMYADLACTRARKYASFYLNSTDDQSTTSSGSSGPRELPNNVKKAINNCMAQFDSGMFYV